MCGIAGIFNYRSDEPADLTRLQTMTRSLAHRGPDDEGLRLDGPLGLGMRRLSIIDLEGGAQPLSGESGTIWVISNGEIYNFRELRRSLEGYGHRFRTRSDTEVIVHAYEQWDFDALRRLNGMFGLAIWDAANRRLTLARDPFGVKPLYCYDDGRRLLFGSEIRAILCDPGVERRVDLEALDEYLTLDFVPAPKTAFAGIRKLLPGHALVVTPDGVEVRRFFEVLPQPMGSRTEGELVEQLRVELARAVERQIVADVPVGALLSGGIDSTAVATLMARSSGAPIKTFTVGFAGTFARNELVAARTTANRIGSDHHEVVLGAAEYSGLLAASVDHLEDLIANPSALAFFGVCRLARQSVKVVLTGQGADEPFAGYARYMGERYAGAYRRIPHGLRTRLIAPLVQLLPRNERLKRAVRSLGTGDPFGRMLAIRSILDPDLKHTLYRNGDIPPSSFDSIRLWHDDVTGLDSLSQMLYADARSWLSDNLLTYGDKMAMAVGLEARVPFLDLELMAFVESLPPGYKIRGRQQKYLLKKAIAAWVPADVLSRPKNGFSTPIDQWLRQELNGDIAERLCASGSACNRYFRTEAIRQMVVDHRKGREDNSRVLFNLLTFELWHERFMGGPAGSNAVRGAGRLAAAVAV